MFKWGLNLRHVHLWSLATSLTSVNSWFRWNIWRQHKPNASFADSNPNATTATTHQNCIERCLGRHPLCLRVFDLAICQRIARNWGPKTTTQRIRHNQLVRFVTLQSCALTCHFQTSRHRIIFSTVLLFSQPNHPSMLWTRSSLPCRSAPDLRKWSWRVRLASAGDFSGGRRPRISWVLC